MFTSRNKQNVQVNLSLLGIKHRGQDHYSVPNYLKTICLSIFARNMLSYYFRAG